MQTDLSVRSEVEGHRDELKGLAGLLRSDLDDLGGLVGGSALYLLGAEITQIVLGRFDEWLDKLDVLVRSGQECACDPEMSKELLDAE